MAGRLDRQAFELQMNEDPDDWLDSHVLLASDMAFPGFAERTPVSRLAAAWNRLRRWRTPLLCGCVVAGFIGLTLVTVLVGKRFVISESHVGPPTVSGAALEAQTAPEGLAVGGFELNHDYRGRPRSLVAKNGLVAADHGRCSDLGADMLREGGNAVDAVVTTALCQGIMNPAASGLGGGAFILVRAANGSSAFFDAREVAPGAANETMFVGRPESSRSGGLAVAVPMELHGLYAAHARYGLLAWARVVEPVVPLATNGFPAHPYLVAALSGVKDIEAWPALKETFLVRDTNGLWRTPRVNETCCARPALAKLLVDVAREGPGALYLGQRATQLATDIRVAGGIIVENDLRDAWSHVRVTVPSVEQMMGLDVLVPGPPSSALTAAVALKILQGFALPLAGSGSLGMHRMIEALKHAYAGRMSLGDPGADGEFLNLGPILSDLMSPIYIEGLRRLILDDAVRDPGAYGGRWNLSAGAHAPDFGTTHISIVDGLGMAVSMTSTINTGFGSKTYSRSTGILLNNQMDDFSTPGVPNVYGYPPSPTNFIRPRKKPLSSMSPLIVLQDGSLRAVLGASGGSRIISAVVQTFLRIFAYGESPLEAVANPRIHHQLEPPSLFAENWSTERFELKFNPVVLDDLQLRGHHVEDTNWGAVVQAVIVEPCLQNAAPLLHGVCDPRKDGAPAGW